MDKWLDGISPDDRTGGVAAVALRGRLRAVRHYLPLAAERADEDMEYVHELRVWTRRAAAALKLFADLVPGRPRAWVNKRLKRLRRAAGEARDSDVLIRRLARRPPDPGTEAWLAAVRARRAAAQGPIVALHDRLRHRHRFERHTEKLLRHVRPGHGEERFEDWARRNLRPLVEQFFAALPEENASAAAWHRFRIRGKKLRYAMELLAGAFPPGFRDELYPVVSEVQDRLGALNDLETAQAHLRDEAAELTELAAEQRAQIGRLREEFRDWFSPQRQVELRAGFEEYLAAPVPQAG
jgi:CHAD domain-containing protein